MQLIHPIYLNVPMLVAFAGAIRDGLAFEKNVTVADGHTKALKATGNAKGSLGKVLGPFFDAAVNFDGSGTAASEKKESFNELRKHSESSIAICLYDALIQDGSITFPESLADVNQLPSGELIELRGTASKNAIDTIIDTIEALTIMSDFAPKTQKAGSGGKIPQNAHIEKIAQALRRDRDRTPISNMVVACENIPDLSTIVSLKRESLRDLTLSELQGNTVNVLGKVVRRIEAGAEVSSIENYGMSLLSKSVISDLFSNLGSQEIFAGKFKNIFVQGPAIQIFPLMIYV